MTNIRVSQSSLLLWSHRLLDATIPPAIFIYIADAAPMGSPDRILTIGLLGGLTTTFIAQLNGTYSVWRGRSLFASFLKLISSWLITWLIIFSFSQLLEKKVPLAQSAWLYWLFVTPFILILYRILIRSSLSLLRKRGIGQRNVLILGSGKAGEHLAITFDRNPWMGFNVLGFVDDDPLKKDTYCANHRIFGPIHSTLDIAKKLEVDEVFICLPKSAQTKIESILDILSSSPLVVKYIPDLFTFDLMHASIEVYHGIPVVGVYDSPLTTRTNQLIKRLEDIILSIGILTLTSPIIFILACGVKLSSPGPILYRQTRVTKGNKPFEMLKFRSMPVDIEKNGATWGSGGKKATTNFGKFIRKTSLDELPQFINVLKGEMSIVGPRPERDLFVEKFKKNIPRYMQKHMIKAGITGLAQVSGLRGDTSIEMRLEYDLRYIASWSLSMDIKIILKTILKVLKDPSAT